jgi:hypothetical protein
MCLQADLSRCLTCQVPWPSRTRSSATKVCKAALRSCGYLGRGRQRNREFFSGLLRVVSDPREGSKILIFLSRPRLVCSSLLHLRSSWKVNAKKFTLCAFSEVLHSTSPMRQGLLCGIGDWKLCVRAFSAKSAPNSQLMLRKTLNMSKKRRSDPKIHSEFIGYW